MCFCISLLRVVRVSLCLVLLCSLIVFIFVSCRSTCLCVMHSHCCVYVCVVGCVFHVILCFVVVMLVFVTLYCALYVLCCFFWLCECFGYWVRGLYVLTLDSLL